MRAHVYAHTSAGASAAIRNSRRAAAAAGVEIPALGKPPRTDSAP